jgi:hypothetical protein
MLVPWENAVKPPYLYMDQKLKPSQQATQLCRFFFISFFFVHSQTTREKEWKTVAHLF